MGRNTGTLHPFTAQKIAQASVPASGTLWWGGGSQQPFPRQQIFQPLLGQRAVRLLQVVKFTGKEEYEAGDVSRKHGHYERLAAGLSASFHPNSCGDFTNCDSNLGKCCALGIPCPAPCFGHTLRNTVWAHTLRFEHTRYRRQGRPVDGGCLLTAAKKCTKVQTINTPTTEDGNDR